MKRNCTWSLRVKKCALIAANSFYVFSQRAGKQCAHTGCWRTTLDEGVSCLHGASWKAATCLCVSFEPWGSRRRSERVSARRWQSSASVTWPAGALHFFLSLSNWQPRFHCSRWWALDILNVQQCLNNSFKPFNTVNTDGKLPWVVNHFRSSRASKGPVCRTEKCYRKCWDYIYFPAGREGKKSWPGDRAELTAHKVGRSSVWPLKKQL